MNFTNNKSYNMLHRSAVPACFAILLAFIMIFMQVGAISSYAAPGDQNITAEYRYLEGNTPTIAPTITQGSRQYKLLSQTKPVLESSLPRIRTYEYKIDGYLTAEDLAALSEIEGLVVTPVSIALKREVDKRDVETGLETNDVDELPTEKAFEITSAFDPSGKATVVLQRAGVEFSVTPPKPEDKGLPSGYTADIVYRGIETYNGTGYYEAASTYTSSVQEGADNQYIIVATYEPVTPPVYEGGGTPVEPGDTVAPVPPVAPEPGTQTVVEEDENVPPAADETIAEPEEPEAADITAGGAIIVPQDELAQIAGDAGIPLANIGNMPTPLTAPKGYAAWALANLVLVIAGFVVAVVMLIGVFKRAVVGSHVNREYDETQGIITIAGKTYSNRLLVVIFAMLLMIGNILFFAMTENLSYPVVFFDKWTAVNAVILIVEIAAAIFSSKRALVRDAEAIA